jgi:flagellar hook-length control protein FliK
MTPEAVPAAGHPTAAGRATAHPEHTAVADLAPPDSRAGEPARPEPASLPVTGPQPVPTTAPAESTASAVAPSSAAPDAQPTLSASLGRLRHRGDGTTELTVALHPAELGSVGITATVRDGLLTVTVACADRAAHDAVAAALPTLRHDLAAAGFTGVDVAFGDRGPQPDPQHNPEPGDPPHPAADHPADPAPPRPATPARPPADRGLDRWL